MSTRIEGQTSVLVNAVSAKSDEAAKRRSYSYRDEWRYYSRQWPVEARPYLSLEPYLRCWLDPEAVFAGKRVLDIGAGEALYARLIADRWSPKNVVACDLFRERMLAAARANRNASVTFIGGDCFRLPFQRGAFDVIFGSLVLHQLPDLDEIAAEVRRVLAPGGWYVGIEPNPSSPAHLWRYMLRNHSRNQYLLRPGDLAAFTRSGFDVSVRYFCARLPKIQTRLLATCMGILAHRPLEDAQP